MALHLSCSGEEQPAQAEPVAASEPPFLEVASDVGVSFQHFIGATGEYRLPEITGSGVALLDFDGDNDLDIFVLQGGLLDKAESLGDSRFPVPERLGNRLYRNELVPEGRLRFAEVPGAAGLAGRQEYGMGAATGDYDNDGDTDLFVTYFSSSALYENDGQGSFVEHIFPGSHEGWGTSATFFDFDRDGWLDLFVARYVDFTVSNRRRCTEPLSGRRDYCGPDAYRGISDRLYRNLGNGRFEDVTARAGIEAAFGPGLGVVAADFDADGWLDVYVANDGKDNQLWMNQRNGTFVDRGLLSGTALNGDGKAEASMGVGAGDVDGDGDEDLIMSHLDGETNTLYLNGGDGNFRDSTNEYKLASPSLPFTGFGLSWIDFDHDSDLDLFVANGAVKSEEGLAGEAYPYHETNQLFRNDGPSKFADISGASGAAFALSEVSRGVATGDIDNDGDLDLVVTNNNGPVRILLNQVGNRSPWLQVQLRGTTSNRDGYGARVAVRRTGQPVLWRRAHTDGSYMSASDGRVHFGLGSGADIESVEVHWPSGLRERWTGVTQSRPVTLVEGTGEPLVSGGATKPTS